MRVLHIAWEYPPLVHGGLARHVEALSRALVVGGVEVVVLTAGRPGDTTDELTDEVIDGVRVVRVATEPVSVATLVPWVESLTRAHVRTAAGLGALDVVHAHDWHAGPAARRIARSRDVPLVATLHATEWGRHAGRLDTDLSRHVHAAERSLATGADRLVVCSAAMAAEVRTQFGVDATVVRNGVIAAPAPGAEPSAGSAPVLVAAGRLEWEKGFSTLLRALPAVLDAHPRTRLVLAGRGSYEPTLRALAESLHVAPAVDFVGWLDAAALARTFGAATAVVVPSRYEPSGLVALEAIAARAPVVVTTTGGLRDLVDEGLVAGSVQPGDVDALGDLLARLLAQPAGARAEAAARAGARATRTRSWGTSAQATVDIYEHAVRTVG